MLKLQTATRFKSLRYVAVMAALVYFYTFLRPHWEHGLLLQTAINLFEFAAAILAAGSCLALLGMIDGTLSRSTVVIALWYVGVYGFLGGLCMRRVVSDINWIASTSLAALCMVFLAFAANDSICREKHPVAMMLAAYYMFIYVFLGGGYSIDHFLS
jgi:hypothetical protein